MGRVEPAHGRPLGEARPTRPRPSPAAARSALARARRRLADIFQRLADVLDPGDPAISWTPTPLTPVWSGRTDVPRGGGAPVDVRLWYPSERAGGPILVGHGRFPLVVLVHGQCVADPAPHAHWESLGISLARSGYIVAAPNLGGSIDFRNQAAFAAVDATVRWVRDASPVSSITFPWEIGIAGHSYGGLLAMRYALRSGMPAVSTLAMLGAALSEDTDHLDLLRQRFTGFRLFAFGGADIFGQVPERDWSTAAGPGHAIRFDRAGHWDFFPPVPPTPCATGFNERGPCDHTWRMTTDMVTVFFGKYLHPHLGSLPASHLPDSLIPPALHPTPEQAPFAHAHLDGFAGIGSDAEVCAGTTRWRTSFTGGALGSATFP